ncbi:hypothetical protein L6258_02185 [Candidatus Parcubacteria bacterium]|nr:hypothetical protein [Candidatus Parcubacteria bacterium]
MPDGVDTKQILSKVIKQQILILGPDIALLKARNVPGLKVSESGEVTEVKGNPREALKSLVEEYVALSGLIVKKTLEPLLQKYPDLAVDAINHS